jgi:hypothetical protein
MAQDQASFDPTRRDVIKGGAGLAVASAVAGQVGAAMADQTPIAELSWLGGARAKVDSELVWGTPWPRGALSPSTQFKLSTASGQDVAVQSWPLAYWPDGTLKWVGHAASAPLDADALRIGPGEPALPSEPVTAEEAAAQIVLRSGAFQCVFPKSGPVLISSAGVGSQIENARLVCTRQDRSRADEGVLRTERFESRVESVTIEQSGPERAVIRIQGHHVSEAGRAWLPFTVRVSLHAGGRGMRIVHSFVFDGDAATDFISGLALTFEVPMRDELHNRHVRFAGQDAGLWSESVRNLPGWAGPKFALAGRFRDQLAGRPVPALSEMNEKTRNQLATVPVWNDYKLFQSSADHFDITKRTVAVASWLQADHGGRAGGTGYAGGISGGVVFGMKDFWQRHPTALEINGAASERASVSLWLWSPDAAPMDLRHYDDHGHGLEIQYEDYEQGHSTPHGIARTTEMFLWTVPATPSAAALADYAAAVRAPAHLVCEPKRYRELGMFGLWGLPDRTTAAKARLEDEHDKLLGFYLNEVDRRQWYGFWSYGDVMHTYDADRHVWRYDVGGYAWANSELVPDLWLWTAFLRSGRADLFRMAEAMTRHTGEVDVYHLGPFAKLGSRHNVSHWGCGAKEARISQALLRRIYYYLTADERVGDLMREVVDADAALVATDPMRHVLPPSAYPTHARSGPDWFAFAGNWLIEWERTGDTRWRDRITRGLDSIAGMPMGMFSGPAFGYDPATATLYPIGGDLKSSYHLVTIFGGAEIVNEILTLIDAPKFEATWLRFCELYNAGEPARTAALGVPARDSVFAFPVWHARLTAYAAMRKNDPVLAARAWNELLYGIQRTAEQRFPMVPQLVEAPTVLAPLQELSWMETNHSSQWSLNLMELMGMVGSHAPAMLSPQWQVPTTSPHQKPHKRAK